VFLAEGSNTQSSDRMKSVELPFPEAKGDLAGKGSV